MIINFKTKDYNKTLRDIILSEYNEELEYSKKIFKEDDLLSIEFYVEMYISKREYVNKSFKDLSLFYKKYLSLYMTNSCYQMYKICLEQKRENDAKKV